MVKVPFIDLGRTENGFLENLKTEVMHALSKNQFVGGPQVEILERELKSYTGAQHAVACANGSDALQIALRTAGVGRSDKVLVPELTFWASVQSIFNVGADPVCVDVSLETLHLSVETLQEVIARQKPKALLMVHLYGWAAPDTDKIREVCKKQKVLVIEDSAQAFGTKFRGKDLLGTADIATTSFYPAKVLGASGDAGAIFFQSKEQADLARSIGNHGRLSHYQHGEMGWNSRVGVYESLYLTHALRFLNQRLQSRRECLAKYRQELKDVKGLRVLSPAPTVEENGYLSLIWVENGRRDELRAALTEKGIGTGIVYPEPMSLQPGYRKYFKAPKVPENALKITQSILSLPCFPGINDDEIQHVCESVRKFFT